MSKIIGFTGTQGCGKSTIVSEIQRIDPSIIVHSNTSARSIVKDMNITFNDSYYSDPVTIANFQFKVLRTTLQSHIDVLSCIKDNDVVITDRTYMDLDSYFLANVGSLPSMDNIVLKYHNVCKLLNTTLFDAVILFPYPTFNMAPDSVRPQSESYRKLVNGAIYQLASQHGYSSNIIVNPFDGAGDIQSRASIVQYIMHNTVQKKSTTEKLDILTDTLTNLDNLLFGRPNE